MKSLKFKFQVIAEHLSVEEVAGIKEGFQLMDTGNKGKIDMNELRVGLHNLGHQIPESDLVVLMEAVSAFSSSNVDILGFIPCSDG